MSTLLASAPRRAIRARVPAAMIRTARNVSRVTLPLELEMLDPLPCGCIAAIFRVGAQDVRVMSLEAKGPYCPSNRHSMGRVVELPSDEEPEG